MDWNQTNTITKEIKSQEEILSQLKQIEWGCRKHNMNKIWIDESHAMCLQCAVEDMGYKAVTDWLKKIKHIR